jgi:hypothetical protein
MPPVILWGLGALGAFVAARWAAREARRVNAELDALKATRAAEPIPNLVRDPATNQYRPER